MRNDETQSASRAALSPREFAASFGKHASWAYRLLYSGKIHAITDFGRILIPTTELERVLNLAQPYNPQTKPESQKQTERGLTR
jgi:hypothetical protein